MYATFFPPHYSGAAKQALALAKQLRNGGHHIEFITLRREKEFFSEEHEGFKVWRIKEGSGKHREFAFLWNFFTFLWRRRNDFDILHSHGAYYYNSFVGPLGRLFRKKSIVKTSLADNDLAGIDKGVSGKLHRLFLKQVHAYIAISRELQEEFGKLNFPAAKVFFLPNGVDTDRFRPLSAVAKQDKKQLLNLEKNQLVALTVGVFDQRKNIGWLIKEWVRSNGFGTNARLVAVGPQSREDTDGAFLKSLTKIADSHPNNVKIVGHVDCIEDYFQMADFYILPSTNEGMPNVVLEALSTGLPCVTTTVSGCSDLVRDGENGFLFPPNDSEGLKIALQKLLSSDLAELGLNSRGYAERIYSLEALAKRYESLYSDLCSSPEKEDFHRHG